MRNTWVKELNRVLWLVGVAVAIGWPAGLLWPLLACATSGYIIWNLFQLKRIHDWLLGSDGKQNPPEALGLWGDICDKIYFLQKEQRKAQAQLEAEVAYLRSSFASLSDAVVMISRNNTLTWSNDAARRNLGLRYPDDYDQPLRNFLRDPAFISYYESGQYEQGVEIRAPVDNERVLWMQITRFGQGNRLLFARDITDVHKLEQMRRDFVSNVSHELRTPLTVISGYIDNFSMFVDKLPALERPLQQMAQHAKRMEILLRDLLELSRLETLPNEMHRTVVSLSNLSSLVVEEARASLPAGQQRHITLDAEAMVEVFGQQTELHSALLNLVVNACKYTVDNGSIQVHCWKDDDGAHFSVTDDGVGIDPLQIPRLTERFYRVDRSRSMDTGGTGLGLAIVKRILQRHEAELEITSALGKGSCFSCHFPSHRLAPSTAQDVAV